MLCIVVQKVSSQSMHLMGILIACRSNFSAVLVSSQNILGVSIADAGILDN